MFMIKNFGCNRESIFVGCRLELKQWKTRLNHFILKNIAYIDGICSYLHKYYINRQTTDNQAYIVTKQVHAFIFLHPYKTEICY